MATSQSEITLYRNSGTPLLGTFNGANWNWPGTALSANTSSFFGQLLANGAVELARWVLVWNPNTPGASPAGVRLVTADSGPTNVSQVHAFLQSNYTNPRVDAYDVTSVLNGLIASNSYKFLGHQTAGTGSSGCYIYGSYIEVAWA